MSYFTQTRRKLKQNFIYDYRRLVAAHGLLKTIIRKLMLKYRISERTFYRWVKRGGK